jgi:hypothetical protein
MTKFFLALIAIGVATLISAFVIAAFRLPDPFLHRPQSLRSAPARERTLTPPPESGEPSGSPADRFWSGVDYPAISANRGEGRRLLSFEPNDQPARGWRPRAPSSSGSNTTLS